MYNSSLKYKWDKKNVLDYAIKTAVAEVEQKAEREKKEIANEMARKLKAKGMSIAEIAELTSFTLEEIEAL